MLQNINARIKGWLAWVIAIIVALTFGLWGVESYLEGRSTPKRAIAKVNGHKISAHEFEVAYTINKREQQAELGLSNLLPNFDAILRIRTLQELIIASLLRQDALRQSMIVSRAQAEADVAEMPFFQIDGQFSQVLFQQALRSIGYTVEGFLNNLQRGQLIDQFRAGIAGSAFALPMDVAEAIKLVRQERSFRYIVLPTQQFTPNVQIAAEAVEQYYEQHKDVFASPEEVAIEYIQLSLAEVADRITVDDEAIAAYYRDNREQFTKEPSWRIARIYIYLPPNPTEEQLATAEEKLALVKERLAEDIAFADLAQTYSDDLLSAKRGGELPAFTTGVVDAELEAIAAGLTQLGEISEPVRTNTGFEIVQLLDRQPGQTLSLDEAKEEIWDLLQAHQARQRYANELETLADSTYTNSDSLEPAAEALGLEINSTDFFTVRGEPEGLLANQSVVEAAFSEDVLDLDLNSDVIQLDPQTAIVLRIKTHNPRAQLPFLEVKDLIYEQLVHEAAIAEVSQVGEAIVQQLNAEGSAQALLDDHELAWSERYTINRAQPEFNPSLINFVFQIPAPQENTSVPVAGRQLENGNYLIVQLESVVAGSPEEIERDERHAFRDQIEHGAGMRDYDLYVYNLWQSAKIKIYDTELAPAFE